VPHSVTVREVGPRDGLQLVSNVMSTATKMEWITRQAAAGFDEIEVTSFVPPKLMPQFSDAVEVTQAANQVPGLTVSALALNLKGGIRALQAGARVVNFVLSASEAHNQSNVRCSTEASLRALRGILDWQWQFAPQACVTAAIATSFGCSLQGDVPQTQVCALAAQLAEAKVAEITLADTVGYANPRQVKRLFQAVATEVGDVPLAAHFHDTRSMGLTNVLAALDCGISKFDAALAGLGGCPFAPGASGNIATEDTVYMLETMGLRTSIDLDALLRLREDFARWLPEEPLQGRLGIAGIARNFTPAT
jgi:hydroxymethylglutaryl-CoA lyase